MAYGTTAHNSAALLPRTVYAAPLLGLGLHSHGLFRHIACPRNAAHLLIRAAKTSSNRRFAAAGVMRNNFLKSV
jgi:hypothetical protein